MIEEGSDVVAQSWGIPKPAASSILSYREGRAALAAARRSARLTARGQRQAFADLEEVQRDLLIIGVDQPLAVEAGRLAEELGLRGYDAVHLASATALGAVTVVTWNRDLSRAAQRQGLAVAPGI